MRTLITARDLVRASHLRKDANVDVLHISASHGKRDKVLRLARRRTRMTANATCLVDDLGPLNRAVLWFFEHESSGYRILARANYITQRREENTGIIRPRATRAGLKHLAGIDKCR
jgi:hypothetical protein